MARISLDKPSVNFNEIKQLAEKYGSQELLESLNENRIGYREILLNYEISTSAIQSFCVPS
jgi:hypothetical protein